VTLIYELELDISR